MTISKPQYSRIGWVYHTSIPICLLQFTVNENSAERLKTRFRNRKYTQTHADRKEKTN